MSKNPKGSKQKPRIAPAISESPSNSVASSVANSSNTRYCNSQNIIRQAERRLSYSESFPFYVKRAKSAYLYDWDKNKYVDFELCKGTLLPGHAHPKLTRSIKNWTSRGYSQTLPTHLPLRLSEWIHKVYPKDSLQALRFFSSKSNAFWFLEEILRKRGMLQKKKGKPKILHFSPSFLKLKEQGNPEKNLEECLQSNVQNLEHKILASRNSQHEIGGICINPGVNISDRSIFSLSLGENLERQAIKNFLHRVKNLCLERELFFILNEETLGFHVALGGSIEYFDIVPDCLFLGSAVGGAFPLYALADNTQTFGSVSLDSLDPSNESNEFIEPNEPNLLAFVAGVQTLKLLKQQNPYFQWRDFFSFLKTELNLEKSASNPFFLWNLGACFSIVLPGAVSISSKEWIRLCLDQGLYLGRFPNLFCFLSLVHGQREIERLLSFLRKLKSL